MASNVTYGQRQAVDFAIIGSGSAGGIIAKELSVAGFDVVLFEQGPYRKAADFTHDEYSVLINDELLGGGPRISGQTFRHDESEVATRPFVQPIRYAQTVGGSSVHFSANFWRLRPVDFKERSLLGPISGTNFADWPISYEELEPYYTKVDWEIELGVVIGQRAQYVSRETALDFVAGYCIVNDVSERELQVERSGGQWDKGKGCDTFGPVGPWLVTKDEIPDPQNLAMCLKVNDQVRQDGNTKTMIFGVEQLVADISSWMTLEPGDIICTGTPPGVAMGMETPAWLKSGDQMHLSIQGLGAQRQNVVAYS